MKRKPGYYEIKPYPKKSKFKNFLEDVIGVIITGLAVLVVSYLHNKGLIP